MHVELISYATGKPETMAHIFGDGRVEEKMPVPEDTLENIAAQKKRVPGDVEFLQSLLIEYSGSYLRARMVR